MQLKEKISEWVDNHRDEMLADICELVGVRSVKEAPAPDAPFGPGCAKALDTALAMCAKYGFAVKNFDHYVGTADLNDKPHKLDILVHLDVVHEGEGWDTDPYTAVIAEDGCIYGRGADDNKGPAVASLYAMRCVRDLGLPLAYNAKLVMGTDEESGSADLDYYFRHAKSAPHTFSPDACFPVYNTEKGFYKPVITGSWEKSEALPRVCHLEAGHTINVIPGTAAALVAGLTAKEIHQICSAEAAQLGVTLALTDEGAAVKMTVSGQSAHAAAPDEGNNGLTALLRLVSLLPLAECGSTRAVQKLSRLFPHGDFFGNALGIAMEDEISGALSVAFSILSLDETGLTGRFDSRVPICANDENCRLVAEKTLTACGFTCQGGMEPGHHTPGDSDFVQSLLRCYEEYTGEKGECLSMGGGTYVHNIEGGVAFGAGFYEFENNQHSANERACIETLLTACKIFASVIAEVCAEQ